MHTQMMIEVREFFIKAEILSYSGGQVLRQHSGVFLEETSSDAFERAVIVFRHEFDLIRNSSTKPLPDGYVHVTHIEEMK